MDKRWGFFTISLLLTVTSAAQVLEQLSLQDAYSLLEQRYPNLRNGTLLNDLQTQQQAQLMRENVFAFRANLLNHKLDCNDTPRISLEVNVFPNPTYGTCTISWPSDKMIKRINTYNVAGEFLLSMKPKASDDRIAFCLDQAAKGTLLLQLVSQDGQYYTKRLVYL